MNGIDGIIGGKKRKEDERRKVRLKPQQGRRVVYLFKKKTVSGNNWK